MPKLHPTSIIERCIAAERCIKEAQAELSEISTDADYMLEAAAADVAATMRAVAARHGDDQFPTRSAEAVLAEHDYVGGRPVACPRCSGTGDRP